jgi:hypothetical protein
MTCGTHTPQNEACKIGSKGPGGGWIFFVDYNDQYPGFTYLEAAPADITYVVWCSNNSTSIAAAAGWAGNAVGKGQENTTAMNGVCTTGANKKADDYTTATESDWFLGSFGEMMLMYTNLLQAGVGELQYTERYWSSTEYTATNAKIIYFFDGTQSNRAKSDQFILRPMRSF